MTIYYLIIIGLLILGYLCERTNSDENIIIFILTTLIVFVCISTLRYSIGFDYFSYESIFKNISNMTFKQINLEYRTTFLGYAYINKIISLFGGNYITLLLICNLFINTTVIWFIYKYSSIKWLSVYLYICFQFLAHSMNLFRQSIAVSMFLLAYPFLINRKFIFYLLLVLIAASIHISGLILIPLYFFINLDKKFEIPIFILFLIFYLFDTQIFDFIIRITNYYNFARYKDLFYWQGNSFKYIILPTIYFGFVLIFRNKLNPQNILLNSVFYTFIIYLYITKHFILERFSIYVFIFSIIIIPQIICKLNRNKNLTVSIVIAAGFIYFLFAVYEGFHNVYPYISIFQKP